MKILIVDDEDFIVSSISKILEKEGFEVEGAGRVLEAKECQVKVVFRLWII